MDGNDAWRKRPYPDEDYSGYGAYPYGGPPEDPSYRGMEPPPSNYRKQDPYQSYGNQSYTGGYNNPPNQGAKSGGGGGAGGGGGEANSWSAFFDDSGSFNVDDSGQMQKVTQQPKYNNNQQQKQPGFGGQQNRGQVSQSYDFSQDIPLDGANQSSWSNGNRGGNKKRGGGRGRGGPNKPWGQGPSPWGSGGGSQWNEGPMSWSDMSSYDSYGGAGGNAGGGGGGRGGFNKRGGGGRGRGGQQDRGGGRGRGASRGRGRGAPGAQQNKPGMPPSYIGGNKKRGGKQTTVPPVHSMATTVKMDVTQMSNAEKIRRFCLFVQAENSKVNSIQTIENGLTGSKLGLTTDYKCEELMKVANKWMYTGCLHLSGVFLARSVGGNKKEVKHDTYSKALEILKTKTVAEIYSNVDPGPDAIRTELSSTLDKGQDISNQATKALQKQEEIATFRATKEEGFSRLTQYLKTYDKMPDSKVGSIEHAITASKCGLEHKYEEDQARMPLNGKIVFRGALLMEGVTLGRAKCYKKKEAKNQTYAQAYDFLVNKPLNEILQGLPPEQEGSEKALFATGEDKKKLTLEEKMTSLISFVKDQQFQDNNINTIDCCALHMNLVPTCIYKKAPGQSEGGSSMICEVYMDNILIGTGEGPRRKEAQIDAYNNAYDTLGTSTCQYILSEHKRFKPEDTTGPDIIDVWVKGEGRRHQDSNIAGLKRNKFNPNDTSKTVEMFVIMEHDDWAMDRKRQAFCILNYSATNNGMLLQWNIEPEATMFKCEIKLQGQHIGECQGPSKASVRNLAAADALFRLYETQSVIKIVRRDDAKLWIAYDNIASKADAVRVASGEPEEEAPKAETVNKQEVKEEGAKVEGELTPLPPPNKWVMKILEEILNTYNGNETLEELIFGPGMPISEKKALTDKAKSLELKVTTRQREGQGYVVIHKSFSPQEMVSCLLSQGGTSGKYSLIPASSLPKHADIEDELRRANKVTAAPTSSPRIVSYPKPKIAAVKGEAAQELVTKLATKFDSSQSEDYDQFLHQHPSVFGPYTKISWNQ